MLNVRSLFPAGNQEKGLQGDRRKLKRKPLVGDLDVFRPQTAQNLGSGFVTNLSEEGLQIITEHELPVGEELSFHFTLPNGWRLDYRGTVIYNEKSVSANAYGIKFASGQGTCLLKLV